MKYDSPLAKPSYKLPIILFSLAMAILFGFTFLQFFFPETAFGLLGFRFYRISYTQSMEPELNYNDLIMVVKYDFKDLKEGDIITYLGTSNEGEEITVSHEIVNIYDNIETGNRLVRTKGVNLPHPDVVLVSENGEGNTNPYIGKVIYVDPIAGNAVAYLSSAFGIMATTVNLLGILAMYIIFKAIKSTDDHPHAPHHLGEKTGHHY